MKRIILSLTILLSCPWTYAQESPHVDGELIVITDGTHPSEIINQYATLNGQTTGLEVKQTISEHLDTWLLRFDHTLIDESDMLREIAFANHIVAAQFNHYIEERAVPNDPQIGSQWHHVDGSDNDIDSDLAWDVTTGGTTANGDDIVVCVIEPSGSNYNHNDLISNHWTNTAEINNGVDDDGNGYIDDINGWNVVSGNDNINPGGHGTAVSGMIGARGNNGIGGSGVNWDVSIMQVQLGSLTEANVLAAYGYAFAMRSLYNSTNGAQGAFVVATNASWGIDFGNPANFPAWCNYYDSLGSVGILNCGATINSDVNVDVVGDMPTGCTSEYMIGVTATNSSDVRNNYGYGSTSIDLAAPGQGVFLPSGSSNYSTTSGTSFASPCVAGSIALLYSAPCANLANLALSDPQGTADIVRSLVLDNVDPIAGLAGDVATGGRLNVNNAMQALLTDCPILGGGVPGCTNGAACNFDATATIDDGSCCFESCKTVTVGGGTFDAEISWNIITLNGGVVVASGVAGTTNICLPDDCYQFEMLDSFGDGWNGATFTVTDELGNEIATGTLDTGASGTVDFASGSPSCAGCTDTAACNYNFQAIIDTGDCCFDNCLFVNAGGGTFDGEIAWSIQSLDGFEYANGVAGEDIQVCLLDGCFQVVLTDAFGDGWNGATWTIGSVFDVDYSTTLESGSEGTFVFSVGGGCEIGCTDQAACNYDAAADINDGSCTYPGCDNPSACNYDPNAGCGGGQCIFENQCDECFTFQGNGVGFYGPYNPFAWSTELNGGDGEVDVSTSYIQITSNNDGQGPLLTQVVATSAAGGDYSFNWEFTTDDVAFFEIGYYINGVRVDLTDQFGTPQQDGFVSFTAVDGDEIGFGIESIDGFGGSGYLLITNFTWPGDDCTGGCTDVMACNYDPAAGFDDGSCETAGCTNSGALNFDPAAVCDNNTCLYLNPCGELSLDGFNPGGFGNYYTAGSWNIETNTGNGSISIQPGMMNITGNNNSEPAILTQATIAAEVSGTYNFNWDFSSDDSGAQYDIGYYINGVRVDLTDVNGTLEQNGSVSFFANAGDIIGFGVESTDGCCGAGHLMITNFTYPVEEFCSPGCTCADACNYDSFANFDDGSCDFTTCLGCNDPSACNFDVDAQINDGSCIPSGCTDPAAMNYSTEAGCDGGTCLYVNGCGEIVDGSGNAAGFVGDYVSDNWSVDVGTGDGNAVVSLDQIVIEGNNNDDDDVLTEVTTTIAQSGTITFSWDYFTNDGPTFDIAYYINGVRFDLTDPINGTIQGDVVSIIVNAGDVLGFGIDSTDGCCGTGYLVITDFTYPGTPCTAGCTYADADNYDPSATVDDGSCSFSVDTCPTDLDNNGIVAAGDLLIFLADFGSPCPQ